MKAYLVYKGKRKIAAFLSEHIAKRIATVEKAKYRACDTGDPLFKELALQSDTKSRESKIYFVDSLISSVRNDIHEKILGEVPTNWDGIELRQYIADKFENCTLPMSRTRKRHYNNALCNI